MHSMHRIADFILIILSILLSIYLTKIEAQSTECGRLNEKQWYNSDSETALNEYPWMGRIGYSDSRGLIRYDCLAVLFNDHYAIAPAHCALDTRKGDAFSLLFGDWIATNGVKVSDCNANGECAPPPEEYMIRELIIHPNYSQITMENDLVLLRTSMPVQFTNYIQPICLLPAAPDLKIEYFGRRLDVVGFVNRWNTTRTKALASKATNRFCEKILKSTKIPANQMCVYINNEEMFMVGSALMSVDVKNGEPEKFHLVGFSIYKDKIKYSLSPDLFLEVWPYREWILLNSS